MRKITWRPNWQEQQWLSTISSRSSIFLEAISCWSKFHIEEHSCDPRIILQITAFITIALADPLCQLFKDSCRSLPASQSASQLSTWSQPFSSQCSSLWQRKFSSNSSERKNLMFPPPQIWRQCCEEAKAVLREHIGDDFDPADGLHLLPLLHHLDHLHRQEEEGHRDGFGRGFAWTGTFAKTGRCTCHWRLKGRKVPALLDHHHLHLHLHLLHHHLHRQLSQVHSHRSQPLWLSQPWSRPYLLPISAMAAATCYLFSIVISF